MLCCKKKGKDKSKKCCVLGKCCKKKDKKSSLKTQLIKKLLCAGAFALLLFVIEKAAEKLNEEE
ncbi:MAG: hypothetical protein K5695_06510 [Oscillospiraceae bacterium]|nr:hypothetical protein [Oscillospiraceae bacterium]